MLPHSGAMSHVLGLLFSGKPHAWCKRRPTQNMYKNVILFWIKKKKKHCTKRSFILTLCILGCGHEQDASSRFGLFSSAIEDVFPVNSFRLMQCVVQPVPELQIKSKVRVKISAKHNEISSQSWQEPCDLLLRIQHRVDTTFLGLFPFCRQGKNTMHQNCQGHCFLKFLLVVIVMKNSWRLPWPECVHLYSGMVNHTVVILIQDNHNVDSWNKWSSACVWQLLWPTQMTTIEMCSCFRWRCRNNRVLPE